MITKKYTIKISKSGKYTLGTWSWFKAKNYNTSDQLNNQEKQEIL